MNDISCQKLCCLLQRFYVQHDFKCILTEDMVFVLRADQENPYCLVNFFLLSLSKEKSILLLKIIIHGDHNNLNVELGFFINNEKEGME